MGHLLHVPRECGPGMLPSCDVRLCHASPVLHIPTRMGPCLCAAAVHGGSHRAGARWAARHP